MAASFDIVVIGGGHAGVEAAHAAARLGADTALVTMNLEAIARMSCNPAIGGLGKGQIVREVDALGGLMGWAIDAVGIQFRLLNRSKGPAVRAPRAQADSGRYSAEVRRLLEETPGLTLLEGTVEEIETRASGRLPEVAGLRLDDGRFFKTRSVIVTVGTFLHGLMHCGPKQTEGGRIGEPASVGLSRCLSDLGLCLARLKTGTPPRVDRESVRFGALAEQRGDEEPVPFSFLTDRIDRPQTCCWITHTNQATHEVIRANLHCAPLYSGQIRARGPRYCPSIEDKVVRFADKAHHHVFLEPEGVDSERIYCNGISTSLPPDVQEAVVHSIAGLEHARILQYGYAIEYDSVPTDQIGASLEVKAIGGLFLAGQINGTSGYEEAAGQGIIAGINAVRRLRGQDSLILRRDQAYIGVMIDDLVTRPPDEPYRMFTSRAEYRMTLRCDNADKRLTHLGRELGLVCDHRWEVFQRTCRQSAEAEQSLTRARIDGVLARDLLRRPETTLADLIKRSPALEALANLDARVLDGVEIAVKYDGYVRRQQRQIERYRSLEDRRIPPGFEFDSVPGLRREAREKLAAIGPGSLGQVARIPGVNPADVAVLWVAMQRAGGAGPGPNSSDSA
ncbi:MAG: tRNA uridine-5-carboxymethylaminomethyl(34) synthesis enzyme MnmG [Phycisphaerales bacterium]|nr:MAG: tRNA uridine-5-carboxymethylaminomethyl(34) synthesis enzyme MnmG [Phycisphaerales bacterium]